MAKPEPAQVTDVSDNQSVIVERSDDGIVSVTLNRPKKRNAIDFPMWQTLTETFREVAQNPDDRVLVLTGSGNAFSGGADLTSRTNDRRHQLDLMHYFSYTGIALHEIPKPTIAKVNGVAVGAGLNLALGCDLIVASESARFSEIFAQRGLSIDLGGSWLLPRLVGLHKAKELVLLGEVIDAREAERIGIVNRVVPDAELDDFTQRWAQKLAAGPPLALQMSKRMLNSGSQMSLSEMLHWESMAQTVSSATKDGAEAMRAFAEKRAPEFKGR
jgi:2-(1,2-epoxy-1,2-dihydrophenyl)acetyl-CoA isomerase